MLANTLKLFMTIFVYFLDAATLLLFRCLIVQLSIYFTVVVNVVVAIFTCLSTRQSATSFDTEKHSLYRHNMEEHPDFSGAISVHQF